MPAFRLTLAYDGAPFVGWQRQAAGTRMAAHFDARSDIFQST